MENKVYQKLVKYKKENSGFLMDSLKENGIYKEHTEYMDYLKSLDNKKVKMRFASGSGMWESNKEKIGRIRFINNELMFFEGRCKRNGYFLTAGLDEGNLSTLVVKDIEVLN